MTRPDLIRALRRMKAETGSLVCLGCGHEHNCDIKGCAIIRAAAEELEKIEADGLLRRFRQACARLNEAGLDRALMLMEDLAYHPRFARGEEEQT